MSRANSLILLCALTSLLVWGMELPFATILSFSATNFLSGRVWTALTTLFVHADLLHLLGNMLFLYVFGNTLERLASGSKMLAVFFTGGVVTNILSIPFYSPTAFLVGASAAIFTVTATVMLIKPLKFSWLFLLPVGLVAILYFLFNILAVYRGSSGNVAYISHIIGFLVGIPFGVAWSPNWMRNLVITLGLLAIFLVFIVFGVPIVINAVQKMLTS